MSDRDDRSRDFEAAALPFIADVARFALHLTREESEVDDLVQETFLRAFSGWHTFSAGTDCRRWLYTICRNAFLRLQQKRHRLVLSEDGDLDGMPAALSHVAATRGGLGDLFDRIDVRPAIAQAVADLPEPHHTIIVLVDLEEMTYGEAAGVLGIPVGTVRSRLYRARRIVQESLLIHARDMGLGESEGNDTGSPRGGAQT